MKAKKRPRPVRHHQPIERTLQIRLTEKCSSVIGSDRVVVTAGAGDVQTTFRVPWHRRASYVVGRDVKVTVTLLDLPKAGRKS